MSNVIYFLFGAFCAGCITSLYFLCKENHTKSELVELKTRAEMHKDFENIIKHDFVQLANETIKSEQEDLRKQNREALEEKILPLKNELGEFKAKVEKFNLVGVENTTKIIEQILILERNNKTIAQEAKNLTEALSMNQNIKGAFGENLLDTILQACGMVEGIHYSKQFVTTSVNLKDAEEHAIRPDVVINLPDKRHVIIDSKVTLTSYIEYAKNPEKLKEFKSEVKRRILDLASKNYQEADDLSQPDFILMYMPIEASLQTLYEDAELINLAYKSKIIIVGTASLLATIRLVDRLFAQQKQCENVNNIVHAGVNLYETFVQFCEDLIDVQRKFDELSKKLNTTVNRFKRGNKNKPSIFSQVEALKEYGISTAKEIPPTLTKLNECDNEGVYSDD